ncbi:hypothetical protein P7C71_g5411, partial [Lecanoromycetidae sp. Uapishka_2]
MQFAAINENTGVPSSESPATTSTSAEISNPELMVAAANVANEEPPAANEDAMMSSFSVPPTPADQSTDDLEADFAAAAMAHSEEEPPTVTKDAIISSFSLPPPPAGSSTEDLEAEFAAAAASLSEGEPPTVNEEAMMSSFSLPPPPAGSSMEDLKAEFAAAAVSHSEEEPPTVTEDVMMSSFSVPPPPAGLSSENREAGFAAAAAPLSEEEPPVFSISRLRLGNKPITGWKPISGERPQPERRPPSAIKPPIQHIDDNIESVEVKALSTYSKSNTTTNYQIQPPETPAQQQENTDSISQAKSLPSLPPPKLLSGHLGWSRTVPREYEFLTLDGKIAYARANGQHIFDSVLHYADGRSAAVGTGNEPLEEGFVLDENGSV